MTVIEHFISKVCIYKILTWESKVGFLVCKLYCEGHVLLIIWSSFIQNLRFRLQLISKWELESNLKIVIVNN